jgi:hypothetical protein
MLTTLTYGSKGDVSGLVFYEFSHQFEDSLVHNNAFEMQRVYLTYQKTVSPNLNYKFQTDVARGKDGWLTAYLKNAKMDWQTSLAKMTLGMQGMNVFNIQEKTWGHRYLEKSPMDKYKFSSSADLGIGIGRAIGDYLYVDSKITNGTGYKQAEDDRFKKYSLQVVWGNRDLTASNGFNVGGVVTYEPFESGDDTINATSVLAFFGGWAQKALRAGVEFDLELHSDATDSKQLIVGYITYGFHLRIAALARIDILSEGSDTDLYGIFGIAITPEKGLRITPNVRYSKTGDADGSLSLRVNLEFKI